MCCGVEPRPSAAHWPIGRSLPMANDNNNIKATWELSLSGALGPQPSAASHTRAYMVHDTFPHLDSQPGSPDLKLALSVAPRASDLADSDRPTSRNKLQRGAWLSFHSRHRDRKQLGTRPSGRRPEAAGRTRFHGQTFGQSVVRCVRYRSRVPCLCCVCGRSKLRQAAA